MTHADSASYLFSLSGSTRRTRPRRVCRAPGSFSVSRGSPSWPEHHTVMLTDTATCSCRQLSVPACPFTQETSRHQRLTFANLRFPPSCRPRQQGQGAADRKGQGGCRRQIDQRGRPLDDPVDARPLSFQPLLHGSPCTRYLLLPSASSCGTFSAKRRFDREERGCTEEDIRRRRGTERKPGPIYAWSSQPSS